MTGKRLHLWAMGVVAALMVAGCTNTRQDINVLSVAQTLIDSREAARQGDQQIPENIVQSQVDLALKSESGPLALIRFDKTNSVAVLRQIETNGPYRTWSTWGTQERRSISTRDGVITSTRGLGSDLMSSDVRGLLRMVTGLEDGIASQVLRHLDGENQIVETRADCAFTPGNRDAFTSGGLSLQVTRVDVFCKTDAGSFQNAYKVGGNGRIVMARQWLGAGIGYATLQMLR